MSESMWPTLPRTGQGEAGGDPEPGTTTLAVLIEQYESREVLLVFSTEIARFEATWQTGRERLAQIARTYRPRHPFMEQSRALYWVDANTMRVVLQGATQAFTVTFSLVEFFEEIASS